MPNYSLKISNATEESEFTLHKVHRARLGNAL